MRHRTLSAGLLTVAIALSASPALAAVKKPTPTTTTIPTLRSSSGNLYKAGEFCPAVDLGKKSHGSAGIIKCVVSGGRDRWENA
jgi:hypothetical protein